MAASLKLIAVSVQKFQKKPSSSLLYLSRQLHLSRRSKKYVEFTPVRYPHLKRGSYNVLCDKDLDFFQKMLQPHQILTENEGLSKYNIDWMCSVRGNIALTITFRK